MGIQATGLILFLGVMFGSMSVVSRYMLQQIEPVTFTAVRLMIAGLVFLILYGFRFGGHRWPKGKEIWVHSILFGIIGDALQIVLFISSLKYLSAGVAAILWTFFPVVSVVLAHFWLPNEKLTGRTILGVLMGLAGALLIVMMGETGLETAQNQSLTGYALLGGSGFIMVFGSLFARRHMAGYPAMDSVCIRIITAGATASIMAFLFEPNGVHQLSGWSLLILVLTSSVFFFGFVLTFVLLKRYGVTALSLVNYIPPVIASVLGMLFLQERITPGMLAGMALILSGLAVINFLGKKPKPDIELLETAE